MSDRAWMFIFALVAVAAWDLFLHDRAKSVF